MRTSGPSWEHRGAIDQQRLGGAAHAGAPHLGIEHDCLGHLRVGGAVHIDVAVAVEMGEHRKAGLGLHPGDEILAAARHDDVDHAVEAGEHLAHRRAVAGRHQLDGALGEAGLREAGGERGVDRARRPQAVRAAAQDRGIAGLEAERAGIGGDVGAAFIDDADDAERHADALDFHAVRPLPGGRDRADGIGEVGDDLEPGRDGRDPLFIEREPVEKRRRSARLARLSEVLGIGGEDRGGAAAQRLRHAPERVILFGRRRERQTARGGPRLRPHVAHHCGEVADPFDTLEICTHVDIHLSRSIPTMFPRGPRGRCTML